jgi:hypothetical protein
MTPSCFLDSKPSVGVTLIPKRNAEVSHSNHTTGDWDYDATAEMTLTWYPDSMHQPREKPKPAKGWDDPTTPWNESALRLGIDDPKTEMDEGSSEIDPSTGLLMPAGDDYDGWLKYGLILVLLAVAAFITKKVRATDV